MKNVYIVDAVRTPFARYKGSLSNMRTDDLAAYVIKALMERHPSLPKEAIDDVILGCHNQNGIYRLVDLALMLGAYPKI